MEYKIAVEREKKINERMDEIEDILEADPASDIVALRAEAFEIMEDNEGEEAKIKLLLYPLAQREKEILKIVCLQEKSADMIEELSVLGAELKEVREKIYS